MGHIHVQSDSQYNLQGKNKSQIPMSAACQVYQLNGEEEPFVNLKPQTVRDSVLENINLARTSIKSKTVISKH